MQKIYATVSDACHIALESDIKALTSGLDNKHGAIVLRLSDNHAIVIESIQLGKIL